jgi:hypothetical protein
MNFKESPAKQLPFEHGLAMCAKQNGTTISFSRTRFEKDKETRMVHSGALFPSSFFRSESLRDLVDVSNFALNFVEAGIVICSLDLQLPLYTTPPIFSLVTVLLKRER